ncbi:MAG: hypothetical protein HLX50_03470 [Alteromonadaceae bacterium]|nr:hypothetical protein [Alteromonadaceae bacterium]
MTTWIMSSRDLQNFHAFRPETNKFTIRRASHLPVEGIGINGTFFIKGWVAIRGDSLFVSASGYSAAMELPEHSSAFNFHGNATLLCNGKPVIKKTLTRGPNELWTNDQYSPIGSVSFLIPPTPDPAAYSVEIEASYIYSLNQ